MEVLDLTLTLDTTTTNNKKRHPENNNNNNEDNEQQEEPQQKRQCIRSSSPPSFKVSTINSFLQPLAAALAALTVYPENDDKNKNNKNVVETIADFLVNTLHDCNNNTDDGFDTNESAIELANAFEAALGNENSHAAQAQLLGRVLNKVFHDKKAIDDSSGGEDSRLFFNLVALRPLMAAAAGNEGTADRWIDEGFGLDFCLVRSITGELKALKGFAENKIAYWMAESDDYEKNLHVIDYLKAHCGEAFALAYGFAVGGGLNTEEQSNDDLNDLYESLFGQLVVFVAEEAKAKKE